MKFDPTAVDGVFLVNLEPRGDSRGGFARLYCEEEFKNAGLEYHFPQINTSWSSDKGTLRGLHYQLAPYDEVKLVRCIRGAVYDVALDLRPGSKTFGKSFGARLDSENRTMMYTPRGCAHAVLTLTDDAEIIYPVSTPYHPGAERGVRWNDPAFAIDWPIEPLIVSEKDSSWPDFTGQP